MKEELFHCPCCGASAAIGYSPKSQFGLPGWTADCTVCTDASRYTRFTREAAAESWNRYAASQADQQAPSAGQAKPDDMLAPNGKEQSGH